MPPIRPGSIVGALVFTLVLIPTVGTRGSQQLLIWLAAASASVAWSPPSRHLVWPRRVSGRVSE